MPIIDKDWIRRLEQIVVNGKRYKLHISIYDGHVHSAVIGVSQDGIYLPVNQWATGVRVADHHLGNTSVHGRWHSYPHCGLTIRQENESVQIRTREHYEIDLDGEMN